MNKHSTLTVGIDLGDRRSTACVYGAGVVVRWFEFPMTPEGVREAFTNQGFGRVAMEAGAQSGWVTRELRKLGYEPLVANPRKLKAISANERKSDRNDALLLARLAVADASLLYPIHHRTEARERALSVLRARDTLVRTRTRLISTIRAMCKGAGCRLRSCAADAFAKREAEMPAELAPATAGLFAAIRSLDEQIRLYDAQLAEMAETTFPETQRVLQVRGVGPVTALAFVLTLEDPARFRDGRTAAAYLGLVPRRDQSGEVDKQLGISKTGSTFARRLLVQCAQYILGPFGRDCDLRRFGQRLMERGGKSAKKRAIVATARKLAVLLYRLWKRDEVWKPLHNAESAAPPSKADAVRPQPAVPADCARFLDDAQAGERRGIDCSADDGPDPTMRRTSSGPSMSADRSKGLGATASTTTKLRTAAPGRTDRPRASGPGPTTPSAPATPACAGDPADPCPPAPRRGPKRKQGAAGAAQSPGPGGRSP